MKNQELNTKLREAIEIMNEVFYLLPVEDRDKAEAIIDKIRNLEA